MFSGIVEEMATLVALKNDKENVDLTLTCSFTNELKIDHLTAQMEESAITLLDTVLKYKEKHNAAL